MLVYAMGDILRKCRMEKGITQEELSEGICTPGSLSKMENGRREPSYSKFVALMQRMGEWTEHYECFIGEKHYKICELQKKIQNSIYRHDYETARKWITEFEQEIQAFPEEVIYHQFLRLERYICSQKKETREADIQELNEILRMTVPEYGKKKLYELFLSYQELTIVNNIALGYMKIGNLSEGIRLLEHLKEYIEEHYSISYMKMGLYSMIILNLVKYLGQAGRFQEGIEEAEKAIGQLAESGNTLYNAELHFDIAWMLVKMNKKEKEEEIRKRLLIAYYSELGNRQHQRAEHIKAFAEKNGVEIKFAY